MLIDQQITMAQCQCGRDTVYIGKGENLNPKIDGVPVCDQCFAEYLHEKYFKKEDTK